MLIPLGLQDADVDTIVEVLRVEKLTWAKGDFNVEEAVAFEKWWRREQVGG